MSIYEIFTTPLNFGGGAVGTFFFVFHKYFLVSKGKKAAAPAKGKEPAKAKPAEKKWTPQDDAARKIQVQFRGYLAKKALEKKKKEKEEYEILMDKLEKEVCVLCYIVCILYFSRTRKFIFTLKIYLC